MTETDMEFVLNQLALTAFTFMLCAISGAVIAAVLHLWLLAFNAAVLSLMLGYQWLQCVRRWHKHHRRHA